MPVRVNNNNNHDMEQLNPDGNFNNQRNVHSVITRNILASLNRRSSPSQTPPDLDEEVIRRRGKRERKSNIVTRSMSPLVLATRKSPIKRPRTNSATIDIINMLSGLQKTPVKTPIKRQKASPPTSPAMMTRRRLNMSCDSGIGSASTSPAPSSPSGSRGSPNKKTATTNATRNRRSRSRRNLRRLS